MIAAVYTRKSRVQSGVADEAKSVARQLAGAQELAVQRGWTIADDHVYTDDGISGAEFAKRPGLVRLVNALKPRPPFDVLIVWDRDRIGREQIETSYILKQLITAGVRVFESQGGGREITLASPTDKIILAVHDFAAEVEREKARQRTTDAMLRKAKAGHVTGGRVYGYDNVEQRSAEGKRLHVQRAINETEAAVVRRIFEQCASGAGFRRIAHDLNTASLPGPRWIRRGPRGWSPSSVRAVLYRDLYRGEIVWNRTQKRNPWGQKQSQQRDEHEWVRVPAPTLRIVSDELWQAAHDRLRGSRGTYLRATNGQRWGKPSNGIDSKYLLTGMAFCGGCGGALTARSRRHGRHRELFYHCLTNVQRGRAVCANDLVVPLKDTDVAVLTTLEEDILRPEVVTAAVQEAVKRLYPPDDADRVSERAGLEATLARITTELARLTDALVSGGDLPSIVAAIQERERQRQRAQQELAALDQFEDLRALDRGEVERVLGAKLVDWRDLLCRNIAEARQALRSLVPERLKFTPKDENGERFYAFEGTAVLDRLLSGAALPKALVAPTGLGSGTCSLRRAVSAVASGGGNGTNSAQSGRGCRSRGESRELRAAAPWSYAASRHQFTYLRRIIWRLVIGSETDGFHKCWLRRMWHREGGGGRHRIAASHRRSTDEPRAIRRHAYGRYE